MLHAEPVLGWVDERQVHDCTMPACIYLHVYMKRREEKKRGEGERESKG